MAIARHLEAHTQFLRWLTCGEHDNAVICDTALRYVVTGALHNVWCNANEHCDEVGDGDIVSGADLLWIDAVSGIQGFGSAMLSVGWVEVLDGGVRFPKFNRHNTSGAERQKRYRDRKAINGEQERNESNVTRNVTSGVTRYARVTDREEESREEERTEEGRIETDILRQPEADGATSIPTSRNGYCPAFLEWWDSYPRKQGKQAAFIAWKKAGKQVKGDRGVTSLEAAAHMLDRVRAYAAAKAGCDLQFIPHPATWLNQARYDDDPTVWEREKTVGDGRARNQGTLERVLDYYDGGNEDGDGTTA
jgi:hypothetical protein